MPYLIWGAGALIVLLWIALLAVVVVLRRSTQTLRSDLRAVLNNTTAVLAEQRDLNSIILRLRTENGELRKINESLYAERERKGA